LKTFLYYVTGVLAIMFLSCAVGSAQVESGQIAGTVADQSGAIITGATVTVKNMATGAERTTQSSETGAYLVSGLEPASYQIAINSANFKPFTATAEVTVGGHTTVDAKLSVSAEITEVQVVGEGGVAVNTQSQELSQVVDTLQLSHLPSLTRNPYDFVALSGNVSSDNTTNSSSAGSNSGQNISNQGVGVSINGQRESGTEILLDGAENVSVFSLAIGNITPIDSVQEYSVVTNNFSAEYGRASGGIVNLTTKSGTNQLHGSAWEFNRLSAYTANTYANDAANQAAGSIVDPKGAYTRNVFGFAAGGPIIKNKLFMFESTEWTRVRSSASETNEILDPSFLALLPANTQAYFSKYGTGAAAASGSVTTAGQLAAASGGVTVGPINGTTVVASSQPVFDIVNFKVPFDAGGDVPQNTYSLVGRIDFNLSDRTTMYGRVARQNLLEFDGSDTYSAYSQYDTGTTIVNSSYLYTLNHIFSPSVLNSAKLSYTRFNENTSFNTAYLNTPNLMMVPPTDPATGGLIQLPGLQNSGEPGDGGLPAGGPQNTIQPQDDLSWTKGRHAMRFGGQLTYIQLNYAYGAYAQAVEQLGSTLQDSFNSLTNIAGNPNGSQLTNFAARVNPQGKLPCSLDIYGNLLTGPSCAVTPPLQSANYARSYRYKDWATYAEDSFHVLPRLTLNFGLRYEHYGVQHNNKAQLDSNFYFGAGSGIEEQTRTGGVQIANQSSIGQFWAPRWGTLAPRVGFAYDLLGNGSTSIRGGYGISYERNFGNVTYNASFNPPASAVLSSSCAPANPNCGTLVTNNDLGPLGLPGPASYLGPVELRMPQPNIQVAQTQFWSLSVQRSVSRNTVVEASYSGAKGTHLYDLENINQVGAGQVYLGDPLVTGPACANTGYVNEDTGVPTCLTRPNQQYAAINMRGSLGSSSYNALNLKFQTQDLHHTGLSLISNYTWSHSLDDLSSTFGSDTQGGSGYIGSLGYTDLLNPGLDWGSSDFNVGNRIVVSPIWETPWLKAEKGLMGRALGGWTASGIITARTGTPFSVFDYSNVLVGYTAPRLTPATPITQTKVASSPQAVGPNKFVGLTVPLPASFASLNPELGISDLGPFPGNMTRRNTFAGPGAWNSDVAVSKRFAITERFGLEFRAEGFDVFNHHNFYVNETNLSYSGSLAKPVTAPLTVGMLKGGLGSIALGGNHDERRFGQFALRATF
jgi:Carboxypeptidase regulatory-like domain/TonB dependent receptor